MAAKLQAEGVSTGALVGQRGPGGLMIAQAEVVRGGSGGGPRGGANVMSFDD
jgi:hypothetical protein